MEPAPDLAATLLEQLPAGVLSAAAAVGPGVAPRFDEEAALLGGAVPKRRDEFLTGRALAHDLLARLGCAPAPLLPGERRAPLWPDGVVGSISHGAGLCVVAVARADAVPGLGLDVEQAAPLKPKLWDRILLDEERALLADLDEDAAGRRAKLLFAAKEALYKSLAPRVTRVLGFDEARVVVDAAGRWHGEVLVDDAGVPAGQAFAGRWHADDRRVLVSAVPRG